MDDALRQMVLDQLGGAGDTPADPLLGALLGALAQQQAERREDEGDDDRLRAELARARRAIARLKENVRAGDTMALFISEVFGCCPICWGLNRLCATCRGEGGPGYREADVERLLDWVSPALARAGFEVVRVAATEAPRTRGTTVNERSDA